MLEIPRKFMSLLSDPSKIPEKIINRSLRGIFHKLSRQTGSEKELSEKRNAINSEMSFKWKMKALIDHELFLKKNNIPINLNDYESRLYSQNGEDGIINAIFSKIGYTNKYYVEFGGGIDFDNTRLLREYFGFNGLLMNCDSENLNINCRREFITKENINELFKKYDVPCEFDFLSIDIDYNDWYVWNSLSEKYKPRVVCIEFNARFGPNDDKLVRYDASAMRDRTFYFGGSMKAFYMLGRKKGYTLVCTDKLGVNLFFIKDDLLPELHFKYVNDLNKLHTKNWSALPDTKNREWTSAKEQLSHS